MSGRAKWQASRSGPTPPPIARTPTPAPVKPRAHLATTHKCRIHRTILLDVDSVGRRFRKPSCLECLPPHHPGCIQGQYVEKQAMFLRFQADHDPDFDLSDEDFWERFGFVPECLCSSRLKMLEAWEGDTDLSMGLKITAWTWRTLRPRLGRLVSQLLGKKAALYWELEQLAAVLAPIPAESAEARARAVMGRLVEFEMTPIDQ